MAELNTGQVSYNKDGALTGTERLSDVAENLQGHIPVRPLSLREQGSPSPESPQSFLELPPRQVPHTTLLVSVSRSVPAGPPCVQLINRGH